MYSDRFHPFLKFKQNEVHAFAELEDQLKKSIVPFFDYAKRARRKDKDGNFVFEDQSQELHDSIVRNMDALSKKLKVHCRGLSQFYFDDFDLEGELTINGLSCYEYMLNSLQDFSVIPVAGIDRTTQHIISIENCVANGVIANETLAVRICKSDFVEFGSYMGEVEEEIGDLIRKFSSVDLIIDCRVLHQNELQSVEESAIKFINAFVSAFATRKVIIAGSTLPASLSEIVAVKEIEDIDRLEFHIFENVSSKVKDSVSTCLGDYGVVSPEYTDVDDIDPRQFQNRTAPKILYPYENKFHARRGGSIKANGHSQYNVMFQELLNEDFFRGEKYSEGDKFVVERSKQLTPKVMPAIAVKIFQNINMSYLYKG